MASKLRRAPLFGIDSGFSIVPPIKPKKKGVPPFHMECQVSSTTPAAYNNGTPPPPAPPAPPSSTSPTSSSSSRQPTPSSPSSGSSRRSPTSSSPPPPPPPPQVVVKGGSGKSQLHVDFIEHGDEVKEKREKYLTAKYGSHQMSLIRKRLAVEMWLYDELQKMFEDEAGTLAPHEVEIDLDEVLDMEGDDERRKFLLPLFKDAKKSQEIVSKFVDEVIAKAKTL